MRASLIVQETLALGYERPGSGVPKKRANSKCYEIAVTRPYASTVIDAGDA
jgi:hypothetical protein